MYRQMQYFIAVVESGSFSEAAEVCHISQSAVSQQIRALEDSLGVALLERHGRRFEVTPAGRWFYRQAKRQTSEMESAIREARRIGRGEHQTLRVGVLNGFGTRAMPDAVHAFATSHPNVRLTVSSGTHEELFQRISDGRLDLVVNDQWRALSDRFVNEALGDQPLYALMRQDWPQAKLSSVPIGALADAMCLVVAPPAQREGESAYWRDVVTVGGDLLFVDSVADARLNAAAGAGWYACDHGFGAGPGMALVPIERGGAPLTRRMFAFWLESNDSSLQWEFTGALRRSIV